MLYILSRKKALCLIEEYVVVFYDLYLKNLSNKDHHLLIFTEHVHACG